jgi:hypothetical protein
MSRRFSLCLALAAGIADRAKYIFDQRDLRRHAGRRIVPRGHNRAFVGMGGTVHYATHERPGTC